MEWTVWPALWVVYGSPCAVVLLSRCARGRCAGLGERGCHSSWDGEGGEVGAGEVCHALEWDTRAASGLRGAAYARNTHYAPGLGCEKPGAPPMGFGPRGDSYTQSSVAPPLLVPRVAPIPALPNICDHLRVLRGPVRGPELGAVEVAVPRVHPVLPAVAIGLRGVLPRVVEVVVGGEVHEVIVNDEIRIIRVVDARAGPRTKAAQNVDVPHLPPADGDAEEREKKKSRHVEESDTSLYG